MSNVNFKTEEFAFLIGGAAPEGVCEARAMTEAQFLAGEDARGVFVVLEPETPLGVGELKFIDCRRFWEIGSALVTEDPRIVIGDLG